MIAIDNPVDYVRGNRTALDDRHYAALTVETPYGPTQFACARGGLVVFEPQAERVLGFVDSDGWGRWTIWRADGSRLGLVDTSDSDGTPRYGGEAAMAWLRSLT